MNFEQVELRVNYMFVLLLIFKIHLDLLFFFIFFLNLHQISSFEIVISFYFRI